MFPVLVLFLIVLLLGQCADGAQGQQFCAGETSWWCPGGPFFTELRSTQYPNQFKANIETFSKTCSASVPEAIITLHEDGNATMVTANVLHNSYDNPNKPSSLKDVTSGYELVVDWPTALLTRDGVNSSTIMFQDPSDGTNVSRPYHRNPKFYVDDDNDVAYVFYWSPFVAIVDLLSDDETVETEITRSSLSNNAVSYVTLPLGYSTGLFEVFPSMNLIQVFPSGVSCVRTMYLTYTRNDIQPGYQNGAFGQYQPELASTVNQDGDWTFLYYEQELVWNESYVSQPFDPTGFVQAPFDGYNYTRGSASFVEQDWKTGMILNRWNLNETCAFPQDKNPCFQEQSPEGYTCASLQDVEVIEPPKRPPTPTFPPEPSPSVILVATTSPSSDANSRNDPSIANTAAVWTVVIFSSMLLPFG